MSEQDKTKPPVEELDAIADAVARHIQPPTRPTQEQVKSEAATEKDDTIISLASPTSEYAAQHGEQLAMKRLRAASLSSETQPSGSKKPRATQISTEQASEFPKVRRPTISDTVPSTSTRQTPLQRCQAVSDLSYDLLSQCGQLGPNTVHKYRLPILGQPGGFYCPRYLFRAIPSDREGGEAPIYPPQQWSRAQIKQWCHVRRHTLREDEVLATWAVSLRTVLVSIARSNTWSTTTLIFLDTWLFPMPGIRAYTIDIRGDGHNFIVVSDHAALVASRPKRIVLKNYPELQESAFYIASTEEQGTLELVAADSAPAQQTRQEIEAVVKVAERFANHFPQRYQFNLTLLTMAALLPQTGARNKDLYISVLAEKLWEQWNLISSLDVSDITLLIPGLVPPLDVQHMACLHFILREHYLAIVRSVKLGALPYQFCLELSQHQHVQTNSTEAKTDAAA